MLVTLREGVVLKTFLARQPRRCGCCNLTGFERDVMFLRMTAHLDRTPSLLGVDVGAQTLAMTYVGPSLRSRYGSYGHRATLDLLASYLVSVLPPAYGQLPARRRWKGAPGNACERSDGALCIIDGDHVHLGDDPVGAGLVPRRV